MASSWPWHQSCLCVGRQWMDEGTSAPVWIVDIQYTARGVLALLCACVRVTDRVVIGRLIQSHVWRACVLITLYCVVKYKVRFSCVYANNGESRTLCVHWLCSPTRDISWTTDVKLILSATTKTMLRAWVSIKLLQRNYMKAPQVYLRLYLRLATHMLSFVIRSVFCIGLHTVSSCCLKGCWGHGIALTTRRCFTWCILSVSPAYRALAAMATRDVSDRPTGSFPQLSGTSDIDFSRSRDAK